MMHGQTNIEITYLIATANILQVECISSFYCYDAEDCPSVDDATRRKMKLTFEYILKTCLRHFLVHQVVCKRH